MRVHQSRRQGKEATTTTPIFLEGKKELPQVGFEPAPYIVYTTCRQVLYQLYLHVHVHVHIHVYLHVYVHVHVHGKKHVYSILAKGKLERSERASSTYKTEDTTYKTEKQCTCT